MDSLHYILLLISIFLICKLFISQNRRHSKNLPPSPPAFPILGHFLHFVKNPPHISLHNLSKIHGPILFLKLGSRPALLLSDLSAVEECFTKNDCVFSNRPLLPSRVLLEYNFSLIGVTPYGDYWRNLRKFTDLEIFSQKCIKNSARNWAEEIKFLITEQIPASRKVDVNSMFYVLTFNVMMRLVAGNRYIDKELDCDETRSKYTEIRKVFNPTSMDTAISDYFPLIRWLPFSGGVEKNLFNIYSQRDKFLQRMIDVRRNATESERSILNAIFPMQESEPEMYSDNMIKDIILVMLIAGTETTTLTMGFAVSQLMSNPEILRKAREEIDVNIGKSRLIEDDDLTKLPYLHCIINEALRLSPTVSILPKRESAEECTVGGYYVPGGTMLLVNAWAIHRDPKLWGEDADVFKPERIEEWGEVKKYRGKFLTFGAGRRQCPGIALAVRLMALAIGTLIQCFEWEEDDQEPESENLGKTRNKPFNVVFRPRREFAIS